jgi:hypothetical protein
MIRTRTARELLYAWHGGQSSPFYAAASSGLVANWLALLAECERIDMPDRDKLREFLKSWLYRAPRVTVAGVEYSVLPWGAWRWT